MPDARPTHHVSSWQTGEVVDRDTDGDGVDDLPPPTLPPADHDPRGRRADSPRGFPFRGWKDIVVRVYKRLGESRLDIIAAGVTFYAFLAIAPAMVALVSLYGLVADPMDVQYQVAALHHILPLEVRKFILEQLATIASRPDTELGAGIVIGVLFSLWSASKGVRALLQGVGITYRELKPLKTLRLYVVSILATAAGVIGVTIILALVVAVPLLIDALGLPSETKLVVEVLRWPVLACLIMLSLAVCYRVGARRRPPRWRWVSWGAVAATLLWLVGSAAFSFFIANFGSYDETYGSLGAVVVTLLWLHFSVYVVLIGSQLNAEMEFQTMRDSTVGEPRPMGQRGAFVADHIPPDATDVRGGDHAKADLTAGQLETAGDGPEPAPAEAATK
ncbi:MAG: YihY/virulence factor BrkB family protein [Myxococcales bacterium]|nr:YihY/virulence factor BrkB family protein [Myxococcales bacterium]MCB9732362.1 YihY/virulence factor BrkB family protein [Deltaproteobacteria bacterium]